MASKKSTDLGLGPPIKFYNDTVTLRFSERDHAYYREEDGALELQDGVTQTCGIIDKSLYLIPWGCKVMFEKLLQTTPHTSDLAGDYIDSIPWLEFVEIAENAKKAHKEKLVDAGDVGSAAHSWLEDSIRHAIAHNAGIVHALKEPYPEDERAVNCGMAAFDWMKKHTCRWLKTEHKIYSKKYKYAGTMDGMAIINACDDKVCCGRYPMFMDKTVLVDWKSSNNLRTEYLLQTAAYEQAEIEEFSTDIYARWVLRLGKEDGKFEPWMAMDFEEDFEAFKFCLQLRRQLDIIEHRLAASKKLRTAAKRAAKVKV